MPIDTNLDVSPFYDDFDENKNYHRVLFRPGMAVQARELTQLQTILQNQIERFGDHIFIEGTIIKGCSFFFDREYYYAKILDQTPDAVDVVLGNYANCLLVDESTNLQALITTYEYGLQSSTSGDFNTLYFKYINVGNGGEKQFSNNSTLTIFNRNRTVESVDVNSQGSAYANGDLVSFESDTGVGASGYIVTHANASIKSVILTNKGSGYTNVPTPVISSNTGYGASLVARNYIDQVFVPANTFSEYVGNPVGKGFAFKVSDGIIYQKGAFIRVDAQSIIVSKYDLQPNNLVVGFSTTETIANNSSDSSLNDNANGFTNENAPGAFRLKLTPNLVKFTTEEAAANNKFFTLVEFENGQAVRQRQTASYSEINKELARRTFEESGNYVVKKFNVMTEDHPTDTTKVNVVVGAGVGYVNGYRVELTDNIRIPLEKASTALTVEDVNISTNFGNYVNINEYKGLFNVSAPLKVSLRDTAGTDVSDSIGAIPSNPGTEIGTAYVKGIEYTSGTIGTPQAQYKLYMFGIQMNTGRVFDSVRSVTVSGVAVADIVLSRSASTGAYIAVLQESSYNTGIFSTGLSASKTIADDRYVFKTATNTTFATTGSCPIDVGTAFTLPYTLGSTLNSSQELDFIVIPRQQSLTTARTGTVTGTVGTNILTGSGTAFLSQYVEGDYISVNGQINLITKIANNTSLNVLSNWSSGSAANSHYRAFPNNTPIPLSRTNATVVIDSVEQNKATISLGETLQSSFTATIINNAVASNYKRTKTLNKNVYVKIAAADLAANPSGPWKLGLPDAFNLVGVYKTSNSSVYNEAVDITSGFAIDNGQRDSYYGLTQLKKKSSAAAKLDGTTNLVVKLDVFTHSASGGYFTVDSYPTSNSSPIESDKMNWIDIPSYVSTTGTKYDLRDCLDTRIVASNTVVVTNILSNANVASQSTTETFATAYFPVPNQTFTANIDKYLPRQDLVVVDTNGSVYVVEGQPSTTPAFPQQPSGTITLAKLNIPPFPTIASTNSEYSSSKYIISLTSSQNKRYTMKDIESMDSKITQLQYYSLLSSLESETKNINLTSESNTALSRFKNGFFVDPLADYSMVNVTDSEFKTAINPLRGEATPTFEQNKFDLVVSAMSGTKIQGELVTLDYTPRVLISQPYATKVRNPVEALWSFKGAAYLNPSYDNYVSTTTTPAVIDMTAWQRSLINSVNDALAYIPINQTTSTSTSTKALSSAYWNPNGTPVAGHAGSMNQVMATTTTTTTKASYAQLTTSGTVSLSNVGNFITDLNLNPYIKGREVTVYVVGLRPGAKHWAFFDTTNVSQYMVPAKLKQTFTSGLLEADDLIITGALGDQLVADKNGAMAAVFYLPDGTFLTGERELVIMDVDDYNSSDSATSSASAKYNAYNMDVSSTSVSTASLGSSVGTSISNTVSVTQSTTKWVNEWDPLAQTFSLTSEIARQGDGLFLTDLDLYFKQKSSTLGIVVEIRTVELGVPTSTTIASQRIDPTNVKVSTNASLSTKVTFDSPVYLQAGYDYAVVLIPEANCPDYLIWTGEAGGTDVLDPALVKNQDWNQGAMFISTNGSTWTAFQNEDIKFNVYFAEFKNQTGTVTLTNDNREYLTVQNVSGAFVLGERVAMLTNNYINKTFTTTTVNNTITASSSVASDLSVGNKMLLMFDAGTTVTPSGQTVTTSNNTLLTGVGTTFSTYIQPGDFIVIGTSNTVIRRVKSVSNNTLLILDAAVSNTASGLGFHKANLQYDIVNVNSVLTNNVTTNKHIAFNSNTTNKVYAEKIVAGVVDYVSADATIMHIKQSNAANSTFRFSANGTIIAPQSNSGATITSVDDVGISYFEALVGTTSMPGTTLSMTASLMDSANNIASGSYYLNDTNFLSSETKVRSRSNEIVYGLGAKSFKMDIDLNSDTTFVSPSVDINPASILRYKFNINNDTTNETTKWGNAAAKYITQSIVLTDGQEAEDVKVYISAYRPLGTDVLVYAKILNETDSELFEDRDWTLLVQSATTANSYSSSTNVYDYRDFEYTFDSTVPSIQIDNRVTANSTAVLSTGSVNFTTSSIPTIAVGDTIAIVEPVDKIEYIRTITAANSSTISLSSAVDFSNTGIVVKKVTQPNAAFKNYEDGSGIVRYLNGNLGVFDGYKTIALKVVMLSSDYARVPRLDSVRAIACSV